MVLLMDVQMCGREYHTLITPQIRADDSSQFRSTLVFDEKDANGTSTCPAGGTDHLTLQPDGTILFRFEPGFLGRSASNFILHRN